MAKTPKDPEGQKPRPSEDEVLRRMLNTPPKPHKVNPPKGTVHDFRTFDHTLSAKEVSALFAGTSSL